MKRSHARVGWIVGLVGGAALLGVGAYALTGGGSAAAATPTPSPAKGGPPATAGGSAPAPYKPPTGVHVGSPKTSGPTGGKPVAVVQVMNTAAVTLAPGTMAGITLSVSGTQYPSTVVLIGGTAISASASNGNVNASGATVVAQTPGSGANLGGNSQSSVTVAWTDSTGASQTSTIPVTVTA